MHDEAYLMNDLHHPHVVKLIETSMHSGKRVIVMPLRHLGCLRDYLREGPVVLEAIHLITYCLQIARVSQI